MAFLFVLFLAFPKAAYALNECTGLTEAKIKCQIDPTQVHPTQSALGWAEVESKKLTILSKVEAGTLSHYLKSHPLPAVVGPDGQYYILDGHHFARAALDLGISAVDVKVVKNWHKKTRREFWQKMIEKNWVYLFVLGRGPIDPSEIPSSLAKLIDDPYRSFARSVRKSGGYKKTSKYYGDFEWADFFRDRIELKNGLPNDPESIEKGVHLARSYQAHNLPGWIGRRKLACESHLIAW